MPIADPTYCSRCAHNWPNGLHSDTCNAAATWLTADLPAMRKIVRAEHPDWTPAQVAVEAIRRIG